MSEHNSNNKRREDVKSSRFVTKLKKASRKDPLIFCMDGRRDLFGEYVKVNMEKVDTKSYHNKHSGSPWHVDWKKLKKQMKVVRARGTYLYTDDGETYLDCVSGVSHVGHCHPHVVKNVNSEMARLGTGPLVVDAYTNSSGSVANVNSDSMFCRKLLKTFQPLEMMNTVLLSNSGSQANDIAIQIARSVTGGYDVVVFQSSFHGCLSTVHEVSSKMFQSYKKSKSSTSSPSSDEESSAKPEWVHVLPIPEFSSRLTQEETNAQLERYFERSKGVIDKAIENGRKIACIITEPIFTFYSVLVPNSTYLKRICDYIGQIGGLVILDEVQTGLGRTGHWWGFQIHGLKPDIVTTGKPLGNGHPMAVVVTSREFASVLSPELSPTFRINPLQEKIGSAILDIVNQENLMDNARVIGQFIVDYLNTMTENRKSIGKINGRGLLIGICLVTREGQPDARLADHVLYKLRKQNIISAVEGKDKNVLFLIPPLCFSKGDALTFLKALDEILTNPFKDDIAPALRDSKSGSSKTVTEPTEPADQIHLLSPYGYGVSNGPPRQGYERRKRKLTATPDDLMSAVSDETLTTVSSGSRSTISSTSTEGEPKENCYDEMD